MWMFTALNDFVPNIAHSMLQYRVDRMDAARLYAKQTGWQGMRFPWEVYQLLELFIFLNTFKLLQKKKKKSLHHQDWM